MLYRVEVRLQGSRWGALSEAERRVMAALAGRVTAHLGDATLLEPEGAQTAASTWHVYRQTVWGPAWAARLWVQAGAADVHRRVRLNSRAPARRLWRPFACGRPWGAWSLTRTGMTCGPPSPPPIPCVRSACPWHARALGLPGMAVGAAVVAGWALAGLGLWWQIGLAPLLPLSAWWVGPWIADRERHSRLIVWLCGLALVGSASFCGFMIRLMSPALESVGVLRPTGGLTVRAAGTARLFIRAAPELVLPQRCRPAADRRSPPGVGAALDGTACPRVST